MRTKVLITGIAVACGLLCNIGAVFADGVIIVDPPRPPHMPPFSIPKPEPLPIKYHRVQIEIDNQVATTSIDQVFRNDYDVDVEGTYIFPLPEDATITDFAMYVDGERVSGEILGKDEARKIYEDIVRRMRDPGLLEYIGRNMFRARVYPIPKHGEKRVELVYQQTLPFDAGVYKYVYPLDTERFSPTPLEDVTVSVTVTSKVPIKNLYSPSHEVDTKIERFQASCSYEAKDVKPDKDFVLYYTVSERGLGLNLLCYREPGDEGYFMMLLSPGQLEGRTIDKDINFILDTSGSMSGDKIKQAKEALQFCIRSLGSGDRFNVIRFAADVDAYREALVAASEKNIQGALDFIDGFKAQGGTDINTALVQSLKMFDDSDRPQMVVFLTDGEPTVGVTDMKGILDNVATANGSRARLFVFGVGHDVNTHLLDKIAETHRGVSEYVVPGEDIEVTVSSFYGKISEPILSDIDVQYGKIKASEVYPVTLPDIFRGGQLILLGRYEGDGDAAITLTGYVGTGEKKFSYEGEFPREDEKNDFIPRLWATRKIGYLMSEIHLEGENEELIDEIVRLSKEHGIMTPYTSFLILEKDMNYRQWGIDEAMVPGMRAAGDGYRHALRSLSGKKAVESAMDINVLKKSDIAPESTLETVRHVGSKTFYLRDGVWVDAEYKEGMKAKELTYLSDQYFEVLKRTPELGRYFAIAQKVVVVHEGACYRVIE
jgi:uncharacterized protein YegL